MKPYTTLQPTRTVMRTHVLHHAMPEIPLELPGIDLWIMVEPSGLVWSWDGWQWN